MPSRCASACASSQSASHGLRGSSGPVEVRADDAADAAALEAALAVVAEARQDATERLGAGVEMRAPGVVLEASERSLLAGLELALEQHVADHAPVARDGLEREQADSGHVLAVKAAIAAAEQLIAAADGERSGSAIHRLLQRLGLAREIVRDEQLLAVLPAADVVEVVLAGRDRVSHPERGHVQLVSAPGGSPRETAMLPRSA